MGHDFGDQVAYSYAAVHSNEVSRLVILDVPIPGIGPGQNITGLWWAQLHMVRDILKCLLTVMKENTLHSFIGTHVILPQSHRKISTNMLVIILLQVVCELDSNVTELYWMM